MNENNIVKMVEALSHKGNVTTPILKAEISSVSPLIIIVGNAPIQKNLYLNPTFSVWDSKGVEEMENIFPTLPSNTAMEIFLKEFFTKYLLKPGDEVIVFQADTSFYILEKVVNT